MSNQFNYDPKWNGDVLNRASVAKYLTTYLDKLYGDSSSDSIYSDSFVLCLNADWGYGKTFLIQKWADDLRDELKHPVVYFDAWKNDFSEDPLVAFISELEAELEKYKEDLPAVDEAVKSVLKMGKAAIVPAIKTAANIFVKKMAGSNINEIAEIYESVSDASIQAYVDEAVNTHKNRKHRINQFSEELEGLLLKLTEHGEFKLPMYVFIDELDRCKPSYAIQLLEAIKHIFGTKGVFFIVATNKLQLSHSIKAVYGTDFDSLSYLQRFFDQEYKLSKPNYEEFSKNLINKKYRLEQLKIADLDFIDCGLVKIFSTLSDCFELTLRSQDQVAKQLKAIDLTGQITQGIHAWYLIFLMMFKAKTETDYYAFVSESGTSKGTQLLKKWLNSDKFVFGRIDSNDPHTPAQKGIIKVIAIINEYIRIKDLNLLELRDEMNTYNNTCGSIKNIKMTFRSEVPKSFTHGEFYPLSIAQYTDIVDKAGSIV